MSEHIEKKLLVLSGKGGVGKSSIAVNLAAWLTERGERVGLLDIDIHGPSVPKLLALEGHRVEGEGEKVRPVLHGTGLKVMSIGFMLEHDAEALIWRGPMKHNVIKQFTTDVAWGDLDYLVVDCPPGTGDEALSIAQLLGRVDGAIIVTTPQDLAVTDVRKCITFCRKLSVPILGVIENMSGFVCPRCKQRTDIFPGFGGRQTAADFGVPFPGSVPMDPAVARACDLGNPFIMLDGASPTVQALRRIFEALFAGQVRTQESREEQKTMRIAIPLTGGRLSAHFGHCEQFAIIDADREVGRVTARQTITPPPHEPGILPGWLSELHVDLVICGGIGQRARQLFEEHQIEVVVGSSEGEPEDLVLKYLAGRLECGQNICDH
jgi:ATP-binding protein involved in chromosome partitioning